MLSMSLTQFDGTNGIHRREFLRIGALSGLGVSLAHSLALRARSSQIPSRESDVNCILIWTLGGTSHHDTFDPKPYAPDSVRGEYKAIDTAVPGIQFTEVVPRMAAELKRFAVLRGWNPQNAGHGVADQWMMSGQPINPTVHYPCYGSIISSQKGFKTRIPPFVQLGNSVDRTFGGGTAGYLGAEHNPFILQADPNVSPFKVEDITLPQGIDLTRIERRRHILAALDGIDRHHELEPAAYPAQNEHIRRALDMITAPETKAAFDIDSEDAGLRDRYGRNNFGQSCLLARRLIEAGVRFVTVSDGGWDHHQGIFPGIRGKIAPLDQAVPTLLADLEARGMLASTLVVWLTDFGRTPKVNSASGRDHWASTGFAIMAGAGVPGGAILGATDADGGAVADCEYLTRDIAATIYTKLGIPLDLITHTPDGRPIRLNEGRPIREWM